MIRVQALMGHADANTLLPYGYVQPAPLADFFRCSCERYFHIYGNI